MTLLRCSKKNKLSTQNSGYTDNVFKKKKKKGEIKTFSKKMGEFIASRPILQEMLEILQAEQIWYQLEIWIYTSKLTMLATE